jgi:Fe2+ or Zn2+ uptake regulation protein
MIASNSLGSMGRTSTDMATSVAWAPRPVERVSAPLPWPAVASAGDRDQRILQLVRAQGGRVTPAKRAVVEVLARSEGGHLTAEDLIAQVTAGSPATAASTIYRVLQQLEEIGAVEHVHPGRGPAFYHLREVGHAHLVCQDCGAITDVPDLLLDGLRADALDKYGFAVDTHHAAVLGRCRACRG